MATESISCLSVWWCTTILLLVMCPVAHGMCPKMCRCSKDRYGLKQVICDSGGMEGAIPTSQMENDIYRLVVTAPPYNPNKLAISRVFYKFTQIREIHITNSLLPAIGEATFKGLYSLQILNLTDNNITQLLEYNFQDLISLRSLHLDNNNIQHTPSAAFHFLQNLTKLTLSRNKMTQLMPRFFLKLSKLEVLNLNSNPLDVNVDVDVFKDVSRLKDLHLSDCSQSQFNSMILRHLPRLTVLDLSYNKLQFFSIDDVHYASRLDKLYLHGNRIPSIFNGTFGGMNLSSLTLSFNQLQFLHRDSFNNVTIQDLDLSFNHVKITDPELLIHLAPKLKALNVGGNLLSQSTLSKLLATLPNLQRLGISSLNLKEIDPNLLQLPAALTRLNVSANGLAKFPAHTLFQLKQLETLDLSRNDFRGLDNDLIDQFDRMHKLHDLLLNDNPWSCDLCYIPTLLAWLNNSRFFERACLPTSPSTKYCLRCASPPELYDRAIQLIDDALLGGCEGLEPERNVSFHQGHVGLVVACIIFLLLLVTVVVILIMYYRRGAEYYTHEEDREEDGIYENPGVDDETGDLLNDKKTKVTLPSTPPNNAMPDGNGHAAQTKAYSNSNANTNAHMSPSQDNGRINTDHF